MNYKQKAFEILERLRPETFALGEKLFSTPELGFKEHQTAQTITDFFSQNNISYESGIALTGVKASLGECGYHIALLADMDALEVQGKEGPLVIHSCGHSIQVTVMLAVMRVLKELDLFDCLPGRVSFVATPAEEYIDLEYRRNLIAEGKLRYASGKQNMIADGLFDDVDCALSCHISGDDDKQFDVGSTLAGFSVKKARFIGLSSHSGVVPHLGKNALHAATLCLQACAFLQHQFAPEAGIRLHPILTQGGLSMNIIPEQAVLETYLRANTTEDLYLLQQKFDDAALHCAAALGIGCEIENTIGYLPLRQSEKLNQVVYQNMLPLCGPDAIAKNPVSGASGDIGDVASILPAVQFGFSGMEGRVHSDQFQISDLEHAYIDTAKVLLGTVLDLMENNELQVNNRDYAKDKQAYLRDWLGQSE